MKIQPLARNFPHKVWAKCSLKQLEKVVSHKILDTKLSISNNFEKSHNSLTLSISLPNENMKYLKKFRSLWDPRPLQALKQLSIIIICTPCPLSLIVEWDYDHYFNKEDSTSRLWFRTKGESLTWWCSNVSEYNFPA